MENVTAVLFAVAAIGGPFLAIRHVRGQSSLPAPVAVIHGLAAASGLVLLVLAVVANDLGRNAIIALVVLVVAALAGFYLVSFHIRGERHPTPVVLTHAAVAVIGNS